MDHKVGASTNRSKVSADRFKARVLVRLDKCKDKTKLRLWLCRKHETGAGLKDFLTAWAHVPHLRETICTTRLTYLGLSYNGSIEVPQTSGLDSTSSSSTIFTFPRYIY